MHGQIIQNHLDVLHQPSVTATVMREGDESRMLKAPRELL